MKFKGKTLSRVKCVNNILRVYKRSNGIGLDWYKDANLFASNICEEAIDLDCLDNPTDKNLHSKFIGIIAALSPLKSWDENKKIAIEFLYVGRAKHTKLFRDKANSILKSSGSDAEIMDILQGNKISAFYWNIKYFGGNSIVTIDRHALSIAIGKRMPKKYLMGVTKNQYEFFSQCYIIAAKKANILPSQMQAVTWVEHRKNKGLLKKVK